jgi:transposase
MLGVSCGAVSQWLRRAVLEGRDSLRHRRDPGRASRLSPDQTARLATVLAASPRTAGVEADQWTRVLVRDLILREFGVSYHLAHVSRLLRTYGASFANAPSDSEGSSDFGPMDQARNWRR